jgi:dTDP-4-amino-4,6-dideoxygalactose transaminase
MQKACFNPVRIDPMPESLAINGSAPVRTEPFASWPIFGESEEQAVLRSLRSGNWGKLQGTEVKQFEETFAKYHEARFGYGVCNGTIALKIALLAAGICAGDEVIVPPYSFVASATAVVEVNARPVFVDIDLETSCIDPDEIEKAITPKTRAIIVVHLGGLPCDMDRIMEIAKRHNLKVIEDACHAHGSQYKGRSVGSLGDIACFSFQSSKNVCAGEGGIILTNDEQLAGQCWSIHNCGRIPDGLWYEHHRIGGNYRMSELQGALLNAQWQRYEDQLNRRNENGLYLDSQLTGLEPILPQRRTADCDRHAYQLYSFRIDPNRLGRDRAWFIDALEAEGIPCLAGYPIPLYREPLFVDETFGPFTGACVPSAAPKPDCPQCEILSTQQGVWLMHQLLLGERSDMDDIVRAIRKVVAAA